ncbi:MAG: hypothetical protein AAF666_11920 [Pseudomonadota bacterium]
MYKFLVKSVSMMTLAGILATTNQPAVASAQTVCGKRDDIISQLQRKYGETRRSLGVQQGRGVVEIYASAETGSWTILVTDARGMSCLMAAGEAFEIESLAEVETPT